MGSYQKNLNDNLNDRDSNTFESLAKSLPLLAKVIGGYATITDKKGVRLKVIDSNGKQLEHLEDLQYELAREAAKKGEAVYGNSQLKHNAEAWCLPVGDYVLCCSKAEVAERNRNLEEALLASLPYIAKVAGGQAVLFDDEGKRLNAVNSKGDVNNQLLGKVSEAAKECMKAQKPVLGKSTFISGASAVRIPITKEIGFGFNNEDTALKNQKLLEEVKKYQTAKYNFTDIIGESQQMRKAKELGEAAASSDSSVLICGETGTGKELFAQSIHNASYRCSKPFIAINCAALPPSLIESNLFGYVEGAFTGAKKGGATGVFEKANNGTLFLDEISEMDLDLQSKLLRVLQEKEVTRIGGRKVIPLNLRIIAATNRNLEDMIQKGQFRRDLFFRLNVIEVKLPPLRDMKEDIPLLVNETIIKMNSIFGKAIKGVDKEALEMLINYDWPGNVRELYNCIERAFNLIGDDNYIRKKHLNFKFNNGNGITAQNYMEEIEDTEGNPINLDNDTGQRSLDDIVANYEKQVIEAVLKEVKGIRAKAAKRLNISPATLWRKMKKLNIEG
ncbi:sigma-54 interaction domain-containing protein [Natranaerobius thermophilus]|uniref:Putative sigma54 specific transcriptional regulator n=1 Tax=Natranaerobius thermophilus (strain ATCC BAA-1301 / DSM 18059 / JW/NM-WN-LF) TaxID=457570 RepID=B2A7L9_NATTJ|nr:sigma 54-interacting transcriptional regulator [Natranaerobius thermophilus]ACB85728.1 putative sigma54 specific transcriptional regulator [Natranaerobius thermophilus JW/NM-WN-LF]